MLRPVADTGWRRLARVLAEEAKAQRLSWSALARRARVSPRTLFDLRQGDRSSYEGEILDRIETALGWQPGSIERVLEGRAPTRMADPDLARIHHAWRDLPPEVRRVLADVAEHYRPG
jgi:transcriptional regulator with XRE-family HTH domain